MDSLQSLPYVHQFLAHRLHLIFESLSTDSRSFNIIPGHDQVYGRWYLHFGVPRIVKKIHAADGCTSRLPTLPRGEHLGRPAVTREKSTSKKLPEQGGTSCARLLFFDQSGQPELWRTVTGPLGRPGLENLYGWSSTSGRRRSMYNKRGIQSGTLLRQLSVQRARVYPGGRAYPCRLSVQPGDQQFLQPMAMSARGATSSV